MAENEKDPFKIGSTLFRWIWGVIIGVTFILFILNIFNAIKFPFITISFLMIILFFPYLKSFSFGNLLKMEFKEVKKNFEDLKTTIINRMNVNQQININTSEFQLPEKYGKHKIIASKKSNEYLKLGSSLTNQSRFHEGIKYLDKAIVIDERSWAAHMILGAIYINLLDINYPPLEYLVKEEKISKAIYHSHQAIEIDPNHYNQFMNLGLAYMKLDGDNANMLALKYYNIAYEMLNNEANINKHPWFVIERCKVKHYMGEASERLSQYEHVVNHEIEAISIIDECTDPLFKSIKERLRREAIDRKEKSEKLIRNTNI